MASTGHTYGPSCLLQTASNAFIRRASEASVDPPKIAAQFFYCNTQPIDDPLSPVPPPSNNPAAKASKVPPRPFSVHDNLALEAAWLKLQKAVPSKKEAPGSKFNTSNVSKKNQEHINDIIKHAHEKEVPDPGKTNSAGFEAIDMKPESRSDAIGVAIGNPTTAPGLGKEHRAADQDLTLCDDPKYIPFDETMPVSSEEIGNDEFESGIVKKRRSWSPFGRKEKSIKPKDTREGDDNQTPSPKANVVSLGSSPLERDTSGTPFLRIPSRMRRSRSPSRSPELKPESDFAQGDGAQGGENYRPKHSSPLRPMLGRSSSSESGDEDGLVASSRSGSLRRKEKKSKRKTQQLREEQVAVGLARLHVVRMPSLKVCTPAVSRKFLPAHVT